MAGLDKMKEQILSEARAVADIKIKEARQRAEEITEGARREADELLIRLTRQSAADSAKYTEKTDSSADMQRRTKLLAARQELIEEVLADAYDKIDAMPAAEYTALLLEILKSHVKSADGELYLSQQDEGRISGGFAQQAEQTASAAGGSLSVSASYKKMDHGFILLYGDIEENCTIKALFNDKNDDLKDKIHQILFS